VPLEIRESNDGEIFVLELVGRLDTKTSGALEKSVATHLAAGQRRFVLDLASMEYVSSAGLRIFLMLAKKVSGGTGSLALCGLSPQVKEVFDIAGFTRLFTLAATRAEALAGRGKGPAPAAKPAKSTPATPAPAESLAGRAATAFGIGAPGGRVVPEDVRALAERAAAVIARAGKARAPG
jgi:anti-anti-sigma factor